ncbi:MAG TPA: alpha/beta hydrolase [Candidatus Binataceae bacterium]|nr:alpha/beta hydrolase [Candidatus Binataceae bacterium]
MDQQIGYFHSRSGARIAYSIIGEGPALVQAGPRIGHLTFEWGVRPVKRFYEALGSKLSLIRYDSLGTGLSDWERPDFSIESELRILTQLIQTLGLERFSLFGFDVGGPTAVSYAALHPEQITSLVLCGTYANGKDAIRAAGIPEPVRGLILDHWALASRLVANIWAPEADGATYDALSSLMTRAFSGDNAMKLTDASLQHDVTELLAQLKVPVTVIHRAHDPVCPYVDSREMARRIPGSHFVPLEGTSHFPFLGNVDSLVAAIVRAIGDQPLNDNATAKTNGANGARNTLLASAATRPAQNGSSPARMPSDDSLLNVVGSWNGSSASRSSSARHVIVRREGDYWTIESTDDVFRIKDSRGLNHLVQLLRYPNREFAATELEARIQSRDAYAIMHEPGLEELAQAGLREGGPGDAGPMLDARAQKEYRRRQRELADELEEAKSAANERRAASIERELEFISRELARAVGLGGRNRRSASEMHRARVNVSRAVRRTIEKIRSYDPVIANALTLSIRLGVTCVYQRDLDPSTLFEV